MGEDVDLDEDGLDFSPPDRTQPDSEYESRRKYEIEEVDNTRSFGHLVPTSPRAAFRFGFLVRQVRIDHRTFWAAPDVVDIGGLLHWYKASATISAIQRAGQGLASEFIPNARGDVTASLDALDEHIMGLTCSWQRGARMTVPIHASDPAFDAIWEEFRARADSALPQESPLRAMYDAGAVIGHHKMELLSNLAGVGDGRPARPLPDIRPLGRALCRLPAAVLDRSPLAALTAQLFRDFGSGSPERFLDRFLDGVDEHRAIELSPDDPRSLDKALRFLYVNTSNSLNDIELDTLAPKGLERRRTPKWDRRSGELLIDGEVVWAVPAQASNVRLLLDAFEQMRWANVVDNPLRAGGTLKREALHQAVKGLKRRVPMLKFGVSGGAETATWDWSEVT